MTAEPISQRLARRRARSEPGRLTPRAWRQTLAFYGFIAPWLLGFIALTVFPLLAALAASLTNYDGLNLATVKFQGLANYLRVFTDPDAVHALKRTAIWSAVNTPLYVCACFLVALLLNQSIKARGFFRTLFYLPTVLPLVTTVWVWKLFLDANNGLLNALISLFRPGTAIKWLPLYSLPSLSTIALWGGLGFGMVIFLAGLQGVPTELVEAAQIDGASTWQVFRHVTLPLMTPVIFFMLVLSIISSLQELQRPLLLGLGAGQGAVTPRDTYLFMIHTYKQIFVYQRFGYGMALLWVLIVLIVVFTLILFRSQRYWVHYEVAADEGER